MLAGKGDIEIECAFLGSAQEIRVLSNLSPLQSLTMSIMCYLSCCKPPLCTTPNTFFCVLNMDKVKHGAPDFASLWHQ